jgi:ABC-type sugar transport system ATPase subunit
MGERGFVKKKKIERKTQELLDRYNLNISASDIVGELSIAMKQMIEIIKAISKDAKIIVMDEPTSSLTLQETSHLFEIITSLKEQGKTIIYISHRMEEVFKIGDYVTVFRDGMMVGEWPIEQITRDNLISSMVGRVIEKMFPKENIPIGEIVLKVEGLTKEDMFEDISFELRRGEVLGFFGLIGAGRTELAMTIFGEYIKDSGNVFINGKKAAIKSPADAIKQRIAYIPEDRKTLALDLNAKIPDNNSINNLDLVKTKFGFNARDKENLLSTRMINTLNIKTQNIMNPVNSLSGGNQQKVVLAKWLTRDVDVLIMDEPTRGIDVGAKEEIHKLIMMMAKNGVGIILISSEMPVILGMSDRIVIMHDGKMKACVNVSGVTHEQLLSYSLKTKNIAV